MSLPKRYNPRTGEPQLQETWEKSGVYHFDREATDRPVYSIDTPPATVSGHLHLGHVYSYSHPDFIARFWRMNGYNVFYPMGYDDNGLPTGAAGRKAASWDVRDRRDDGREAFIEQCLEVSRRGSTAEYEALWQRLGALDRLALHLPHHRRRARAAFAALVPRAVPTRGWPIAQRRPPSGAPSAAPPSPRPNWTTWSARALLHAGLSAGGWRDRCHRHHPPGAAAGVRGRLCPSGRRALRATWSASSVTVPLFGQSVPVIDGPRRRPGKGHRRGDVLHLWRRGRCGLVVHAQAAAGRGHRRPRRMTGAAGDHSPAAECARGARARSSARWTSRAAAAAEPVSTDGARPRALRHAGGIHRDRAVVRSRAGFQRSSSWQAGEQIDWHPPHMETRYRAVGGEPGLGLVHLAPALLWRALSGLVLRGLRRGGAGRRGRVAGRPTGTRPPGSPAPAGARL